MSCNATKDAIRFSLLNFFNCPLVRICDAMIKVAYAIAKHTSVHVRPYSLVVEAGQNNITPDQRLSGSSQICIQPHLMVVTDQF